MTEPEDFADARAHLSAALRLLDGLGIHAAAADVCQALHRLEHHPRAAGIPNPDETQNLSTQ